MLICPVSQSCDDGFSPCATPKFVFAHIGCFTICPIQAFAEARLRLISLLVIKTASRGVGSLCMKSRGPQCDLAGAWPLKVAAA